MFLRLAILRTILKYVLLVPQDAPLASRLLTVRNVVLAFSWDQIFLVTPAVLTDFGKQHHPNMLGLPLRLLHLRCSKKLHFLQFVTDFRYLDTNSRCTAIVGYYDNFTQAAQLCSPNCQECKSFQACLFCSSGSYLFPDSNCYASCPARYFPNNRLRACQSAN